MFGLSFLNSIKEKKQLIAFLEEMDKNLELFYVMDQRQFITENFCLEAWEQVKDIAYVKKHESILVYASTLLNFNNAYKEYKDFEAWYTADISRKSPDNAKKLHALKHELDMKLKGLDAVIIPAGQALERELLALGYIKE